MADLGASPFTITATSTYEIPLGVYSLRVVCRGGGAAGSNNGLVVARPGGGGGGGGYALRNAIRVIPRKTYTFTVGAARAAASQLAGNPTTFTGEDAVACTAAGGGNTTTATGGTGGAGTAGDTTYTGGTGGTAANTKDNGGGGGGEGACSTGNGNPGSANTGATGGPGGTGCDGGDGGPGGNNTAAGGDGIAPGGAGGGAGATNDVGGGGARGEIVVTYTTNVTRSFGGGYASPGSMGFSLLLGFIGRLVCSLRPAAKNTSRLGDQERLFFLERVVT